MADTCLAAQLYTVRHHTKTAEDFAETARKVRQIGYQAVQLSGHGPIPVEELKRILDGEGLYPAATHIQFARMRDEPQKVIDDHKLLGCEYTAVGGMPTEYRTEEGFHRFAHEASEAAARLVEAGLTFAYHNHHFEFERFSGRTGYEILFTESDPRYLKGEPDTYWIQAGGGDPSWWIRWLHDRAPLIHLKDMAMKGTEQIMTEVGEGNLNWPAILDACKAAGAVWYMVEQDTCAGDPFDSLAISYRNLLEMGLR